MFTILKNLDRRIIFLFIALAVIITLKFPLNLSIVTSKNAKATIDLIDTVNEGDAVIVSFDYAASGAPELEPMAEGVIYRLFQRKAKVIVMGFWDQGPGLADSTLKKMVDLYEKHNPGQKLEYGKNYINIGYKAGGYTVIINMSKSIKEIFTSDKSGVPIETFPIMENVNSLKDIKMAFSLTGGNNGLLDIWLPFARQQYGLTIAGGCTSVSAPQFYQYMQSGQISALMDGFKTAAELLKGIDYKDPVTGQTKNLLNPKVQKISDAQSVIHLIIIGFIILANVTYFYEKKNN